MGIAQTMDRFLAGGPGKEHLFTNAFPCKLFRSLGGGERERLPRMQCEL